MTSCPIVDKEFLAGKLSESGHNRFYSLSY
jgi:hypothetical protein